MKIFLAWLFLLSTLPVSAGEWSGNVSAQTRLFTTDPAWPDQRSGVQSSIAVQPEYFAQWDNNKQSFTFVPFARVDSLDPERTHADIRELTWLWAKGNYEWRIGVRKVFWGVAEAQHIVDIINQSDFLEDPNGDEKLGQPMINFAARGDFGTLDFYFMQGFRQRLFPGNRGRLRLGVPIMENSAVFESAKKWWHPDTALRWSRSAGAWDMALTHFSGTSREPRLVPELVANGQVMLRPYYDTINQSSLEIQRVHDAWLLKLEAIRRSGNGTTYRAVTAGFEYAFGGELDMGLIAEYLYDDRDREATTPFQNDIMVGLRVALNDVQSTEALIGLIYDMDNQGRVFSMKGSRRLFEHWKLNLKAQFYDHIARDDVLYSLADDDFVQVELVRYF